ncbi:hypothetical protein F2Q69_00021805 [Brassica cretica]|nr:hypothetical protein F2Q69_00021805 [Brassica cretica]
MWCLKTIQSKNLVIVLVVHNLAYIFSQRPRPCCSGGRWFSPPSGAVPLGLVLCLSGFDRSYLVPWSRERFSWVPATVVILSLVVGVLVEPETFVGLGSLGVWTQPALMWVSTSSIENGEAGFERVFDGVAFFWLSPLCSMFAYVEVMFECSLDPRLSCAVPYFLIDGFLRIFW